MASRKKPVVKSGNTKKKKRTADAGSRRSDNPIVGSDASAGELEKLSESEERYHLFQGILQSSSDGILAVNRENEVLFANQPFVEMWRIPKKTMAKKDDTLLLQYVLDQLTDPQGFLDKVRELYNSTEESFDTLNFKDGRVFDRLSRPLLQGTELLGRVWSFRDITEGKRAEEALRESEERYHSLFDRMMDGVYLSTHKGRFVDVNPAMVKMFGYSSREEMLKVDIKKELYFAPEERGSHVLDTGQEEMEVYRMRRKDGFEIWVEDHGFYVHNQQGRVIFHEGMLRDITDRKRIENALTVSEAELRTLFGSMHDVVLVIDREGVYRKIAPTNPRLLVKPPDELLGKNLNDVFPFQDAENFRGVIKQVLDTKQSTQIEYELVIDGQTMWFQTTISPLDADSTLWVAHDITERKHVEKDLHQAEEKYRSIFENSVEGIFQSTPQGRFITVNPAFARMLGYESPEELIATVTDIASQIYMEAPRRTEFMQVMAEYGRVSVFEFQMRRKDGNSLWVSESAHAVRDSEGRMLYYEGIAENITERKQVEEELRLVKDGLETTNIELQQSLEREKLLASTDGLTGLCNHRHFFELAAREFQSAVRYRRPLTFLMFDMDDFKQVNDTFGHSAGDRLLVMVAQTAVAQVRGPDVVARYGGDEFIVLLPDASAQQALPVAERIRAKVEALRVKTDKIPFTITLSIGIAEMRHEPFDENVERIIQRADEALYKAKESGRNCTVIFGQDEAQAN